MRARKTAEQRTVVCRVNAYAMRGMVACPASSQAGSCQALDSWGAAAEVSKATYSTYLWSKEWLKHWNVNPEVPASSPSGCIQHYPKIVKMGYHHVLRKQHYAIDSPIYIGSYLLHALFTHHVVNPLNENIKPVCS